MRFTTAVLAAVSALATFVAAEIDTVTIQDRHFFYTKSGKPFFIKGVDYQPGGSAAHKKGQDPLSDINVCARDIYLFQQLGINTIRVYSVDPDLDHDECMTLMAQAGIYLVLDVNSPLEHEHLNNEEPWTTYTPMYLENIFKTVDHFSGYPNTLAFLAGNEVIFDDKSAKASPNYVKAVVRDLKAYITNHVSRIIPVGYSNADDLKFRNSLAHYLECGDVGYIDFWGVNSYQWCGSNTFSGSGYDVLVEDYLNYTLPVFFTEFGCNESPPRLWEEIDAMYSEQMTHVFAGGLVYEFTQEPNNYGIVKVDKSSGAVATMDDYESLQKAYKGVTGTKISPKLQVNPRPRTCPKSKDKIFNGITANLTLPNTLGAKFIKSGVTTKTGRGKFTKVSVRKTKLKVTVNGKTVSDPTVKQLFETDNQPLAAGGHGKNVGGGNGEGEPSGIKTSNGGDDDEEGKEGAAAVTGPRGIMIAGSLAVVAVSFMLL